MLAALAAALTLAAGPAQAGPSPADGARLLARAAAQVDLRGGDQPFLLVADILALRLSNGRHPGTYLLAWESPARWRQEVAFAGFREVEVARDGELWRERSVGFGPVRVRQLKEAVDVAGTLALDDGETVVRASADRARAGPRIRIELDGGAGGPRTVELERDGFPAAAERGRLRFLYADPLAVGPLRFPRRLVARDADGAVLSVTVRRLEPLDRIPDQVFEPPRDAMPAATPGAADSSGPGAWEDYRRRIARFIDRGWQQPRAARLGREGVVLLRFQVLRDGEVRGLRLLRGSGSEALDQAALAAVARAAPLPSPPLPAGAPEDRLEVTWRVVYNLHAEAVRGPAGGREPGEELPEIGVAGGAAPPPHPLLEGPRPRAGTCPPELAGVDAALLAFLREQRVPGAAFALVRDGRLVASRGYGWADLDAAEPMRPDALFRLASLSKAFTAVAILQLVEEGAIELDEPVLRYLDPAGEESQDALDPRLARVTVRHLLQHRAGLAREPAIDPLALPDVAGGLPQEGPLTPTETVRLLATRRLDHEPGERFAYSNLGYGVLGRVIEVMTGEPYERRVRERVLEPLGIRSAAIGRSAASGRLPGEVRYHTRRPLLVPPRHDPAGELVPIQYGGWCVPATDAHGGWVGSAVDLARFAAAFDHPRRCPLLGRRLVRQLFARPPGLAGRDASGRWLARFYACGFQVEERGLHGDALHWHDGRLPGASALLVRDGRTHWAVLFNQDRGADGMILSSSVAPILQAAVRSVSSWPEVDLFDAEP